MQTQYVWFSAQTKICILVKLKIVNLNVFVQCRWLYRFYRLINLWCYFGILGHMMQQEKL